MTSGKVLIELATDWQPMETAPIDREIQVRIPGHGSDNVVIWDTGYLDSEGRDCGCWVFSRDQEPPDCWSEGVCWEVNEDGLPSVKPTAWKDLPALSNSTGVKG